MLAILKKIEGDMVNLRKFSDHIKFAHELFTVSKDKDKEIEELKKEKK